MAQIPNLDNALLNIAALREQYQKELLSILMSHATRTFMVLLLRFRESLKGEVTDVDTESPVPSGNKLKPWSFGWQKVMPLLFIVVIACFFTPLSDSPVLSSTRSLVVESLNEAASRFRDWSTDSIAYVPIEVGSYDLVNLTFQSVDQYVESYPIFSTKSQIHQKVETQMGDEISASTEEEIQDLEIGIEDVSEVLDVVDEDEDSVELYTENDLEDVAGTFNMVHEYEGKEAGPLEQDVSLDSDVAPYAKFDMENDVKDVGSTYESNREEALESENEANCVKELEGGESSLSYEDKEEMMVEELDEWSTIQSMKLSKKRRRVRLMKNM